MQFLYLADEIPLEEPVLEVLTLEDIKQYIMDSLAATGARPVALYLTKKMLLDFIRCEETGLKTHIQLSNIPVFIVDEPDNEIH